MDILHRKLLTVGEPVFFVRSSVENPFIYLKFAGVIKEVETYDDQTTYRIQLVNVLEDYDTILMFLNRVRFRVRNNLDGKFIDKYFYTYDIPTVTFNEGFCERFSHYFMDVPSMFCFPTVQEMEQELSNINLHISNQLSKTLKWVGKRIIES